MFGQREIKQMKEIIRIQKEKEEVKLSVVTDSVI
jgi:hypothetical protein